MELARAASAPAAPASLPASPPNITAAAMATAASAAPAAAVPLPVFAATPSSGVGQGVGGDQTVGSRPVAGAGGAGVAANAIPGKAAAAGRGPKADDRAQGGDRSGPVAEGRAGDDRRERPFARPVPRSDEADAPFQPIDPSQVPDSAREGANERARSYGVPPRSRLGGDISSVGRAVPVYEPVTLSARQACGKRVFIAMALCMDERCEEPRYRNSAECGKILEVKRARENR
jgi:hypothetical protein